MALNLQNITRCLISVSDKTGIVELAVRIAAARIGPAAAQTAPVV